MNPSLSILAATLLLASVAHAAPAPGDYPATAPPAYDDGMWYPGKYPGDPTEHKKEEHKPAYGHADEHKPAYEKPAEHHKEEEKKPADYHEEEKPAEQAYGAAEAEDYGQAQDYPVQDGYGADDSADDDEYGPPGSPYDYAPHGRERSYSRSRERVNQWHDANGHGKGHSYNRSWHGEGQYYLQRRGAGEDEPRGRTLVRRGEDAAPVLEKRGNYGGGYYGNRPYYGYGGRTGRIRPLKPIRPIGGSGYYPYLYKRGLDTEKPALEKRSEETAAPVLEKRGNYGGHHRRRRHHDHDHDYYNGPYHGNGGRTGSIRPIGGGYYPYLYKRGLDTEESTLEKRSEEAAAPVLEKRQAEAPEGSDGEGSSEEGEGGAESGEEGEAPPAGDAGGDEKVGAASFRRGFGPGPFYRRRQLPYWLNPWYYQWNNWDNNYYY